jgi:predicted nucleic acid-binding protein
VRVVDASVVLGWLLREPLPQGYQRVLADHVSGLGPAVAPELLNYEVANVLARGVGLGAAAARAAYDRFAGLEIETFALSEGEYRSALELALAHRITVYDASYVALAQALGTRFVTADRRMADRIAALGVVEVV